jgi:hypothetical protein
VIALAPPSVGEDNAPTLLERCVSESCPHHCVRGSIKRVKRGGKGTGGRVINEAGPNELAGTRDRNQFAVTVGRVSVTDVFDANRYANDPTDHFFNWGLFASAAWDYPADTRGYTWGVLGDLAMDWWSARFGFALEPKAANARTWIGE